MVGAVGGLVAVVGAILPWLSFFGGLVPVPGTAGLAGQAALALAATSAILAMLYGATGTVALRWALAVAGAALLAVAGLSAVNLATTLPALQADPLTVARAEPGIAVLVVGAAIVFSTFFLPAGGAAPTSRAVVPSAVRRHARPLLVGALGFAGLVHLSLGPTHFGESVAIGAGMVAGGVAQLGLALLVGRAPAAPRLAPAVVALSAVLVVAWIAAVTVGLPVEAHGHSGTAAATQHGSAGHVEGVTVLGATTAAAELMAIGLAMIVLRGRQPA